MAGRPAGVKSFVTATGADQLVFTGPGNLYSVNLSWNNQTVGDRIIIWDAITNDTTAVKLFEFLIPTTAGSYAAVLPAVGKVFGIGMFLNPNLSAVTNDKIKVDIGYDGV